MFAVWFGAALVCSKILTSRLNPRFLTRLDNRKRKGVITPRPVIFSRARDRDFEKKIDILVKLRCLYSV